MIVRGLFHQGFSFLSGICPFVRMCVVARSVTSCAPKRKGEREEEFSLGLHNEIMEILRIGSRLEKMERHIRNLM
jgi:hypothetical protein